MKLVFRLIGVVMVFAVTGVFLQWFFNRTSGCPEGQMTVEECEATCETDGSHICIATTDGTIVQVCYECGNKDISIDLDDSKLCPEGTTSEQDVCSRQCNNGLCKAETSVDGRECYSCVTCPDETYSALEECRSGCERQCEVVASEGALSCWQCPAACEQRCLDQGYIFQEDYSDLIATRLLRHECVSGVSITIARATVGACTCTQEPEIIVDERVPVCSGTPCGDVLCGKTEKCYSGTVETTCEWLGWQKEGPNQFRPSVQTRITQIGDAPIEIYDPPAE